jgi:hypothetical protein
MGLLIDNIILLHSRDKLEIIFVNECELLKLENFDINRGMRGYFGKSQAYGHFNAIFYRTNVSVCLICYHTLRDNPDKV